MIRCFQICFLFLFLSCVFPVAHKREGKDWPLSFEGFSLHWSQKNRIWFLVADNVLSQLSFRKAFFRGFQVKGEDPAFLFLSPKAFWSAPELSGDKFHLSVDSFVFEGNAFLWQERDQTLWMSQVHFQEDERKGKVPQALWLFKEDQVVFEEGFEVEYVF